MLCGAGAGSELDRATKRLDASAAIPQSRAIGGVRRIKPGAVVFDGHRERAVFMAQLLALARRNLLRGWRRVQSQRHPPSPATEPPAAP